MIVLGIESSCDETSVSLVSEEKVYSNLISSQHFHSKYGGVVPELSSRAHLQMIMPLIKQAFHEANLKHEDIDAIAATAGPGLIGSVLVGFTFAKSFSLAINKPFIPVNHIEGHIFSGFLMNDKPKFPYLCLVVSGGHSLLLIVKSETEILQLGTTLDDAAGEAFDKVSKMLGFGYPGGPAIQQAAAKGNPSAIKFPIAKLKSEYDFSFSGLKTAVLRHIQQNHNTQKITDSDLSNIAASFEFAAVTALMRNVKKAIAEYDVNSLSVVGGVAANLRLRNEFIKIGEQNNINVVIPENEYCGDNGAMIAQRGLMLFKKGQKFAMTENVFASLKKSDLKYWTIK